MTKISEFIEQGKGVCEGVGLNRYSAEVRAQRVRGRDLVVGVHWVTGMN